MVNVERYFALIWSPDILNYLGFSLCFSTEFIPKNRPQFPLPFAWDNFTIFIQNLDLWGWKKSALLMSQALLFYLNKIFEVEDGWDKRYTGQFVKWICLFLSQSSLFKQHLDTVQKETNCWRQLGLNHMHILFNLMTVLGNTTLWRVWQNWMLNKVGHWWVRRDDSKIFWSITKDTSKCWADVFTKTVMIQLCFCKRRFIFSVCWHSSSQKHNFFSFQSTDKLSLATPFSNLPCRYVTLSPLQKPAI